MESFGNEIKVQQGEAWSLDLTLSASNREYIPYLISSERRNPFFVVTVASTKYEKNQRYVKSWWNAVDVRTPRFYQTTPQYVGEVDSVSDIVFDVNGDEAEITVTNTLPVDYEVTDAVAEVTTYTERYETRLLYQFTLSTEEINKTVGHKPYHYIYVEYEDEVPVRFAAVDSYKCEIKFDFSSQYTSDWTSQDYMYQITLVSGQLMADRLEEIYNTYHPLDWPETIEAQYKYVKIQWPNELQPDIDADSPLGYIEVPQVILQPTKLEVFNNLRTII